MHFDVKTYYYIVVYWLKEKSTLRKEADWYQTWVDLKKKAHQYPSCIDGNSLLSHGKVYK